jgi:hypothetical protein
MHHPSGYQDGILVIKVEVAAGEVRMAILSTDPGIHRYSTHQAHIWRTDHTHGFHRADIQ